MVSQFWRSTSWVTFPFPPLFGALLDHFKYSEQLGESETYMKSLAVVSFILAVVAAFVKVANIGRTRETTSS